MNLPLHSDLGRAEREFERRKEFQNLARLIRMSLSAQSAQTDLERAKQFFALANRIALELQEHGELTPPKVQNDEAGLLLGSVISSAIMTYCRAADGRKVGGRKAIPLSDSFTLEEKDAHKRILDVRDKALAHFDKTGHFIDGPWAVDRLILNHGVGVANLPPRYQWNRTNYRENIGKDIGLVLMAAERTAGTVCASFQTDLNAEIEVQMNKPEFWSILQRSHVPEAEVIVRNETLLRPAVQRQ